MRILHNTKIYTLNDRQPAAAALAIDDHAPHAGRVLAIGDDKTILDEFSHRAEIQDMNGAVILPGLTDAHIHLENYALNIGKVDLFQVNKTEALQRVVERVKETPPGNWIQGHGWNQSEWAGDFPTAADLDGVAPNHPVFLTHVSLHSAWANSAAFKAAGVDRNTPDPANGEIQRDESGNPTGVLFEGAADLISAAIPQLDLEEVGEKIMASQEVLWQVGLTGLHTLEKISGFKALQTLNQRGELKLRFLVNLPVEQLDHIIEVGLFSSFGDDMLRIGGIKVFMDGALGPLTAAMLEPYIGEPEQRGMLFLDKEELFEISQKAARGGLPLVVHAIGDAANHEALIGLSQLRAFEQAEGYPHGRHRIEHVQLLHPDDLGKLAELDVIASMQPIHATSDMVMADRYWGERSQYGYAWRTLIDKGTRMAFGSDAPVDSPNPFHGIHAAVTRRRADGSPGPEGWVPAEKITVEEALHGYTTGPAYAAYMEHKLGQLAPGYLADLIVVETDPFTCPPEELRDITPQGTMVGGDWVWEK
jgi:predicted amidohydrolase YtcJ